ncbi:MAG: hypothetical protein ABEI52_04415, partial [Halobacteriaceae archaeon]
LQVGQARDIVVRAEESYRDDAEHNNEPSASEQAACHSLIQSNGISERDETDDEQCSSKEVRSRFLADRRSVGIDSRDEPRHLVEPNQITEDREDTGEQEQLTRGRATSRLKGY